MNLEPVAIHARNVENLLRRDFRQYSPIIEIEVAVEGFIVKAVAGDDKKSFSDRRVVPYDCDDCLLGAIDEACHRMREKMRHHV